MKKVLPVSTAHTIHGVEIVKSLGFVSAHVIAGTNIFSDIFAAFSDIFGGRSQSYKRQLTGIKNEVVQELMDEAVKVGGDAIVGMSIDLDEVSGSNKSMFMITATGTAVKVSNSETLTQYSEDIKSEIDPAELHRLIFKAKIINLANENRLSLSEEEFKQVIEQRIFEIADYIIESVLNGGADYRGTFDEFKVHVKHFFSLMPKELAIDKLYSTLLSNRNYNNVFIDIIKECNLFDYKNIKALLESNEFITQKLALSIMCFDKQSYTYADIKDHECLLDSIDKNITPVSPVVEVKKLLGSKRVWKCNQCATEVPDEVENCQTCGFDIYGLESDLLSKVKVRLNNKIIVLKEVFPEP
jgi:uncharacterized protein YbjQ (UPF0145 family)